jgi:Ca2+-binding RTX toxin-like protein
MGVARQRHEEVVMRTARPERAPSVRRVLALALVLALVLAAGGIAAPSARAGIDLTCTYDSGTKTVTATAVSDFQQVAISRNGDEIEASSIDCGDSTRFNTDKIIVNDVPNHELTSFVILDDLIDDGPLRPGATDEPGSSDEIELEFNLGNDDDDFIVRGSSRVRAGTTFSGGFNFDLRYNLNAGESTGIDADVVVKGADDFGIQGTDGADKLSAAGGAGTGKVFIGDVYLSGEQGGIDVLVGGIGDDDLDGFDKADKLRGGAGEDDLDGGKGSDELRGNEDNDKLFGSDGKDKLLGGPGDDSLNGGAGVDSCDAGSGTNTVTGCE